MCPGMVGKGGTAGLRAQAPIPLWGPTGGDHGLTGVVTEHRMPRKPPTHPHSTALAGKPPPSVGRAPQWVHRLGAGGVPSCLAHQLVPRDGAEEGVGFELGHPASAQTPLGVVLQELQGKQREGEHWESCPGWVSASLQPRAPSQAPHLGEQRCGRQAEPLWQLQLGVGVNP